ncbi:thrombospondin [Thraustotheca clavata]|uniref:Thrombospondin n=1 Tax=Thraustotheca clavata TaxID=74557 RepID=A0A1V9YMV3_9STRA|nr:thrombospondin [Thraustotheca clavata]
MRLSLSIGVIAFMHSYAQAASYSPSQIKGISDPVLIAKIEGYMPPICSTLYGDAKHWSPWSNCSATCGQGQQVRYLNGVGQKNMVTNGCDIQQDTQQCTGTECPQDCQYSDWVDWSPCDATTGTQVHSRTEVTPALNGGKDCPSLWGPPSEKRNCAVDCQGTWSNWTDCSGVTATSSRTFTVTQYPLNGGVACPSTNTKDCNPTCGSIGWGAWSTCDPVTGTHTRTRNVPVDTSFVRLTVALRQNQCPTVDTQACDIDCQLGDWAPTGSCDPLTGAQQLTRKILQQSVNCGKPCNALQYDTLTSGSKSCAVDCKLSGWSDWVCDTSTGQATRKRSITQNPLNDGAACGDLQETKDCRLINCTGPSCTAPLTCETGPWTDGACSATSCVKISTANMLYPVRDAGLPCNLYKTSPCTLDAVMGPWSDWGACDDTAHQYRTRDIVSNACNGGKIAGATTEKRSCQQICQDNFNPWNAWGPCDQTSGTQKRTRTIVNSPTPDQQPCLTTETRTCAVNCVMDNWGPWGKCDECTGIQIRNRTVSIPEQNGGNQCPPTQDSQTCAVTCLASEWTPWSTPDSTCSCTRTRTEIAPAINGGTCLLTQNDPTCSQNCETSDWSVPGECIKSGPHAGTQQSTRAITKQQCNGGAACPADLERYTPCDIDCQLSDWTPFGQCDLQTQQQTRTRSILQPAYHNGAKCGPTTDFKACGSCAEIVSSFTYSECDAKKGIRTGTATYLYKPKNGLACNLVVQEPCTVNCVVSDWNMGTCHTQGNLAGQQLFTRSIVVAPLNGGTKCGDLKKYEKCVVDCKAGDTWSAWSECSSMGFQHRTIDVLFPAQNGGRNDECTVEEQKTCPVDCDIDPATGVVLQESLNGGKTCKAAADELGIPSGGYSDYSSTSTVSFMSMISSNKTYAMAAVATGGMGLMFIAGFFTTRRRNGYNTISHQAAL